MARGCVRTSSRAGRGRQPWAIPWRCLHEFLAIVGHPRIYAPPTPLSRALEQVDAWLESPSLVLLCQSDGYWPALRRLLESGRVVGPQVHDARIAALCRFPDLTVVNPLVR